MSQIIGHISQIIGPVIDVYFDTKGLDPENTLPAIMRACELIEELGCGEIVDGIIDIYGQKEEPNVIPFDPEKPFVTSGIRIGTPAITTRGLKEAEMVKVAEFIDRAVAAKDDDAALAAIGEEVKAFMANFPMPQF